MNQQIALITDANESNRSRLKSILLLRGLGVEEAEGGTHALSILDQSAVDVVFADVTLPATDGFELLPRIKRSVKNNNVPIVLLSHELPPKDLDRERKLGCAGYLVKPFNTAKLDEVWLAAGLFGRTSGAFRI